MKYIRIFYIHNNDYELEHNIYIVLVLQVAVLEQNSWPFPSAGPCPLPLPHPLLQPLMVLAASTPWACILEPVLPLAATLDFCCLST